jgi:transcriptional regulator of acetoin/glycerol metabolism/DNA-binding CsgD family transcriptional regulator
MRGEGKILMRSAAEGSRTRSGASHPDRVYSVVENRDATISVDEISTSWRRCLSEHGIDPGGHEAPQILTAQELRVIRGPVEDLIQAAKEENDRLHAMVGQLGYAVLLTSSNGIVVDFRGDATKADQFKHWGIWMGGTWSEDVEGTNGIGTCIAEQRPITVHLTQHFRTRHTSLSCCGAPIFGPDGEVAAVLDVTSIDPEVSDRAHALALVVTTKSARAIEESLFRQRFRRTWNLAIAVPSTVGRALMLAVDDDQRIVGADRNARSTLGLDDHLIATGLSLWTYFDRLPSLFRVKNDDITIQLTRIGDNQSWPALITPPERSITNMRLSLLHVRPRIGQMDHMFTEVAGLSDGGAAAVALSPREQRILELIAQGQSNKEIARLLRISPETVKSHVKNMFSKLGVERRAQAIYRATNLGLVTGESLQDQALH